MSGTAVLDVLSRAQAELRSLIEQALSEGRYTDVAEIAKIADRIAHIASEDGQPSIGGPQALASPELPEARHTLALPVRRKRSSRSFPRFEREGDKLVKIAWSKKDRAEYEHKAPRHVVGLLIDAIRTRKGEGAKFDAPDVLPLKDSKTRREVPSYQSYLALAWLRHEGVITKYGRDGYALKPTAATQEHITELWEGLPSRD